MNLLAGFARFGPALIIIAIAIFLDERKKKRRK